MPKQTKKKRAKVKAKITFYHAPHIREETTVKHHYTLFSADASGSVSQNTSSLLSQSTSHLPTERTEPEDDDNSDQAFNDSFDDSWTFDNGQEDSDALKDPLFDAAYIEHLEETNLDDKIKRVRPKGVR